MPEFQRNLTPEVPTIFPIVPGLNLEKCMAHYKQIYFMNLCPTAIKFTSF
jgi:hypothetical protein